MILNKNYFLRHIFGLTKKKLLSKFKRWQLPRGQDDGDSKKRLRQKNEINREETKTKTKKK